MNTANMDTNMLEACYANDGKQLFVNFYFVNKIYL